MSHLEIKWVLRRRYCGVGDRKCYMGSCSVELMYLRLVLDTGLSTTVEEEEEDDDDENEVAGFAVHFRTVGALHHRNSSEQVESGRLWFVKSSIVLVV